MLSVLSSVAKEGSNPHSRVVLVTCNDGKGVAIVSIICICQGKKFELFHYFYY